MPKKFKKGAASSRKRAGSAQSKRRTAKDAARKRKRPNAKVSARKPKRKPARKPKRKPDHKRAAPASDASAPPRTPQPRKRRTRRAHTAAETGGEATVVRRFPVVAIVGRPNVGKSSLFNRLAGSRIAIEDPRPGTTRDRVSALVRLKCKRGEDRVVELFDTAGIGVVDEAQVQEHVQEQIRYGVAAAEVVLLVTDIHEGVQELDREAAEMLRRAARKVIVVANKADAPAHDAHAAALFELGLGDPLPASAKGGRKIQELVQAICTELPRKTDAETLEPPELYLAIVGRRNVGKSTLTNALAEDERVITSELEGTTRDSIDVRFTYDGCTFVAIDTAGIRRSRSLSHSVEFFSQSRALRAIRRASVVILMIDAREPIARVDRKLVEVALEEAKPVILAVNKWDLVKNRTSDDYREYLTKKLGAIDFAPVVFMSARNGLNVFELVDIARELHQQSGYRVGTGELNRAIQAAFTRHHPQPRKNKLGRIFYATQVETYPPKIVVFVNDPELFPENWRTYLTHRLQETLPFSEIPLRLKFKAREKVEMAWRRS